MGWMTTCEKHRLTRIFGNFFRRICTEFMREGQFSVYSRCHAAPVFHAENKVPLSRAKTPFPVRCAALGGRLTGRTTGHSPDTE